MPKNIPAIVQRQPRQEAPVAIRIQPPQFPAPEQLPPNPSEPAMATNSTQYAGQMDPSFSPSPAPMNAEQYGGQMAPAHAMPPGPGSVEQYGGQVAPSLPSPPTLMNAEQQYGGQMTPSFSPSPIPMNAEPQYGGQMAPSVPPVPGMQQQMVPPTQLGAERMPPQLPPAAAPGMQPAQSREASPAHANSPFSRMGILPSRGFMPSGSAGNNLPNSPSLMAAHNSSAPPFSAANNPPTPLPSTLMNNPVTPLPSTHINSSAALRPSSAGGEPYSQLASSSPMAGQPVARQGQPPQARILVELDGKITGEVLLQKNALTVGRLSTSDIYIASKRISRQHAQILAEQGAWVIEDAGSVNGLFYQGSHVRRIVLSHGDRIRLAPDTTLIYETIQ